MPLCHFSKTPPMDQNDLNIIHGGNYPRTESRVDIKNAAKRQEFLLNFLAPF